MKHKLIFIHSPQAPYHQNYGTDFMPLWAYTLASHVPPSWDIDMVDCKAENPNSVEAADVFAFSGINQDFDTISSTFNLLKQKYPKSTFIIGGPITWSLQQEGKLDSLDFFDFICVLDGEELLPEFLEKFEKGTHKILPKILSANRFALSKAKKIRFDLYKKKSRFYYGGVLEVSRGCPFLCEFCDIRVLPGNNKNHNKNIDLIIEELEEFRRLGITQVQLACDNFIGDIPWANKCVDAILAWKEKTGAQFSFYTWLTINLYKMPSLMKKMRHAGFSVFFIGIESVNNNSLLETAKVQNRVVLAEAVTTIQEYGFIIASGLIVGFDSDVETVFEETLDFLVAAGLLSGDPAFLMALPGTPLYDRMKQTGRLIEDSKEITIRKKISTNVRYLLGTNILIKGFIWFTKECTTAQSQFKRFQNYIAMIKASKTFIPIEGGDYTSLINYLPLQLKQPEKRKMFFLRIFYILTRPLTLWFLLRALWLTKLASRKHPGLMFPFKFWAFSWTNMGINYRGLAEKDFNIKSVDRKFDLTKHLINDESVRTVLPKAKSGDEKSAQQLRLTNKALQALADKKKGQLRL